MLSLLASSSALYQHFPRKQRTAHMHFLAGHQTQICSMRTSSHENCGLAANRLRTMWICCWKNCGSFVTEVALCNATKHRRTQSQSNLNCKMMPLLQNLSHLIELVDVIVVTKFGPCLLHLRNVEPVLW